MFYKIGDFHPAGEHANEGKPSIGRIKCRPTGSSYSIRRFGIAPESRACPLTTHRVIMSPLPYYCVRDLDSLPAFFWFEWDRFAYISEAHRVARGSAL